MSDQGENKAELKRIDQALVDQGLAVSRARACELIERGKVLVNGVEVRKPGHRIALDSKIDLLESDHPYVSRGALKLAGAVEQFRVRLAGMVALDIGASTGGFTDFLLRNGVKRVFCVDVGKGQLHPSLLEDPRVKSWESSDIRNFSVDQFDEKIDIIVVDVSFVSVVKLMSAITGCASEGTELLVLVKPQFEVGPKLVGKGGIVKDQAICLSAVKTVAGEIAAFGFELQGQAPSVISGADGNQEFFVYAKKK